MIPKIIHTYNFAKRGGMSKDMSLWLDKIKRNYSDFEIKVWNLSNIKHLFDTYSHKLLLEQYTEQGRIGYMFLSYYIRFLSAKNYGGFYIEPMSEIKYNLYDYIHHDCVFEVTDYENINPDFFGISILSNDMINDIVKAFDCDILNKNYTLNLYNPGNVIGNVLKIHGYIFDGNFESFRDVEIIKRICFIKNILSESHSSISKYFPDLSIVVPVYNGEKYLNECINSILYQPFENFELILIDDGSEDNTKSIIKNYNDDRIVYLSKTHSGIVDSLNCGINRSVGKYIIRHDADDIMMPHRLHHQFNFMETHSDVDILSDGYLGFSESIQDITIKYLNPVGYVTKKMLAERNHLSHPSSCFRRSSIMNLPFLYEDYYECAEDYKLWLTAASHGLTVYSGSEYVIYYRLHENSITSTKYDKMMRSVKMIQNAYKYKSNNSSELTCIIPFQNEGCEIEKTVASIRGTTKNINILLVNDKSTDGYDYKKIAEIFNCDYYETEINLGVAGCRDFAIQKCNTEYFILLDGHMRFYDFDWEDKYLALLKEHKNGLVTGNTLVFGYDFETNRYNDEAKHFGYNNICYRAAIIDQSKGNAFTGKWTNNTMPGYENKTLVPIACCMGAVYGSNKEWWNKIDGLKGLAKWGQDEPYMSLKTWLAGGEVLLMTDFCVGHLYRKESTYLVPTNLRLRNRVFLINFFLKDQNEIDNQLELLKKHVGGNGYELAMKEYNEHKTELIALKEHFWNNVATKDLQWFYENINNPVIGIKK